MNPRPYRAGRFTSRRQATDGLKSWHPNGPINTVIRTHSGKVLLHAVTTTGNLVRIELSTAQAVAAGGAIIGAGRLTPKEHQ